MKLSSSQPFPANSILVIKNWKREGFLKISKILKFWFEVCALTKRVLIWRVYNYDCSGLPQSLVAVVNCIHKLVFARWDDQPGRTQWSSAVYDFYFLKNFNQLKYQQKKCNVRCKDRHVSIRDYFRLPDQLFAVPEYCSCIVQKYHKCLVAASASLRGRSDRSDSNKWRRP